MGVPGILVMLYNRDFPHYGAPLIETGHCWDFWALWERVGVNFEWGCGGVGVGVGGWGWGVGGGGGGGGWGVGGGVGGGGGGGAYFRRFASSSVCGTQRSLVDSPDERPVTLMPNTGVFFIVSWIKVLNKLLCCLWYETPRAYVTFLNKTWLT